MKLCLSILFSFGLLLTTGCSKSIDGTYHCHANGFTLGKDVFVKIDGSSFDVKIEDKWLSQGVKKDPKETAEFKLAIDEDTKVYTGVIEGTKKGKPMSLNLIKFSIDTENLMTLSKLMKSNVSAKCNLIK